MSMLSIWHNLSDLTFIFLLSCKSAAQWSKGGNCKLLKCIGNQLLDARCCSKSSCRKIGSYLSPQCYRRGLACRQVSAAQNQRAPAVDEFQVQWIPSWHAPSDFPPQTHPWFGTADRPLNNDLHLSAPPHPVIRKGLFYRQQHLLGQS